MSNQMKGRDTNVFDHNTQENDNADDSKVDTSSEEMQLGLLDQPLVVEGKRKRKSVQSFQSPGEVPPSKKKVSVEDGKGVRMGDIATVEAALVKKQTDELRHLYRLLFDQQGNKQDMRKHIRSFSGFAFSEGSEEHKRKLALLEKQQKQALETFYCQPLGLSMSGSKKELVARIGNFLLCPQGVSKSTPARAPPARNSGRKKRPSLADAQIEGDKVEDEIEEESNDKVDEQGEEGKVDDMESSSAPSKDEGVSSSEEPHNTGDATEDHSKQEEEGKPEKEEVKECASPVPEQDVISSQSNNGHHSPPPSNPVKPTPVPASTEPSKAPEATSTPQVVQKAEQGRQSNKQSTDV